MQMSNMQIFKCKYKCKCKCQICKYINANTNANANIKYANIEASHSPCAPLPSSKILIEHIPGDIYNIAFEKWTVFD